MLSTTKGSLLTKNLSSSLLREVELEEFLGLTKKAFAAINENQSWDEKWFRAREIVPF